LLADNKASLVVVVWLLVWFLVLLLYYHSKLNRFYSLMFEILRLAQREKFFIMFAHTIYSLHSSPAGFSQKAAIILSKQNPGHLGNGG
jgi:hypothetical protein